MRDLGTPVFGRKFFAAILDGFPEEAELCSVRDGRRARGGGAVNPRPGGDGSSQCEFAPHGKQTQSQYADVLSSPRPGDRARAGACLISAAAPRTAPTFASKSNGERKPHPANWQYHVRQGDVGAMRPDNPKYQLMIRTWQRLPLWFANFLGPHIVRGIP